MDFKHRNDQFELRSIIMAIILLNQRHQSQGYEVSLKLFSSRLPAVSKVNPKLGLIKLELHWSSLLLVVNYSSCISNYVYRKLLCRVPPAANGFSQD